MQIGELSPDLLSPEATQRERAEATATQFEEIFVRQMVQSMRDTVSFGGEEGMFGKGAGSGTYEDWFDQHLSRHLTTEGVGLAQSMLRSWERSGWVEPDSETTPSSGDSANSELPRIGGTDVIA